jgi:hypothetical protein
MFLLDMPARTVALLHRLLRQNGGRLSRRARTRDVHALTAAEVERIERLYADSFASAQGPPAPEGELESFA